MMGNAASAAVALEHDLRGPNLCIVTGLRHRQQFRGEKRGA